MRSVHEETKIEGSYKKSLLTNSTPRDSESEAVSAEKGTANIKQGSCSALQV